MPDKADSQPFAAAFAQAFNKRGRLEIYKRSDRDWGWRVVSVHNGKNLTPEGYRRRVDMLKILAWMYPGVEPVEVEGPEKPDPNPLQPEQVVQLIETAESDEARLEIERLAVAQSDNRPTDLDPDA